MFLIIFIAKPSIWILCVKYQVMLKLCLVFDNNSTKCRSFFAYQAFLGVWKKNISTAAAFYQIHMRHFIFNGNFKLYIFLHVRQWCNCVSLSKYNAANNEIRRCYQLRQHDKEVAGRHILAAFRTYNSLCTITNNPRYCGKLSDEARKRVQNLHHGLSKLSVDFFRDL